MKRLSIKARVTIWYTLLVALIAFLAALVLFLSARRMMNNYYLETLTGTAQLALDDIRMEDGELEIDRDLDELPSVRVALFTTSGELIYGRVRFDLPFVEGEMRTATERSGGEWYVLDTRMEFDEAEDIWLRCYISADAAANLGALSMELAALILPMLVVLAGVGGYLIARRAFRPVTRITRTAESIIDGADLQKRIALEGARDELYRLAKVFDDMLDRLERSFERERRFTSDASHELRTPVAAILAQTDFALSDLATPEDRMEALRDIHQRAGQMSTLINRLLALTRMDAGQTRVDLETIDLCDLAEVVAAQIEDGAAERGMTVALSLDGPVWARCDQTMPAQAALNCNRKRGEVWPRGRACARGRVCAGWRSPPRCGGRFTQYFPGHAPHLRERLSGRPLRQAPGALAFAGAPDCPLAWRPRGGGKRLGRGQPFYHRAASGGRGKCPGRMTFRHIRNGCNCPENMRKNAIICWK